MPQYVAKEQVVQQQLQPKPEKEKNGGGAKLYIVIACWIITLIVFVFAYTDFLKIIFPDGTYRQSVFQQVFFPVIVFTLGLTVFIYYFLDKMRKEDYRKKATFIITHPEIQFPKIRKLAQEHYGLELRQCVSTLPDPPLGEAGALPHTLHYLFEKFIGGVFAGYVHISNPLFQEINVFHFRDLGYWSRNTPATYWNGVPKSLIPQRISETSAGIKNLNVKSQQEYEEEQEETVL